MALPEKKKRENSMPAPGPPKTVIAIGIGKPKPGEDAPEADVAPGNDAAPDSPADTPPTPPASSGGAPGAPDGDADDGKVSPEKALVVHADEHCKDCKNYDPMTGDCSKVSGTHAPEDNCFVFFDALNDEPDADDQGGAPDNDADDMAATQGAMSQ